MQIRITDKMARNDGPMVFRGNTIQENRRILLELQGKSRVEDRSRVDLKRLFNKLNHNCRSKSGKDEEHQNFSWLNKNVINYTYGPISGFPSGSWWGIRMDCSRDRIHVPFNEDAQVGPFGVTSICTSSVNVNEDVDFGSLLTLTGQRYSETGKDSLVKNYENQIPIRLVRSYNLLNDFAPKTGYRYDGLYVVLNYWICVTADGAKYYKFALVRLKDQEPPPWNGAKAMSTKEHLSIVHSTPKSLKDCTKCISHGAYEFRKYSHGSIGGRKKDDVKLLSIENTDLGSEQKGATESAIVTRHVFKKTNVSAENGSTAGTSSMLDNKSLLNIGDRSSKAHSTNISIRTGLYDSSHTVTQDAKKSGSLPFCRASKPMTILKTGMHAETLNLANREKLKADVKTDVAKASSKYQPIESQKFEAAGSANVSHSRASVESKLASNTPSNTPSEHTASVYRNSFGSAATDSTKTKLVSRPKHTADSSTSLRTSDALAKYPTSRCKDESKRATTDGAVEGHTNNSSCSKVSAETSKQESTSREYDVSSVQSLKALGSLDSLTPDKILQLINKEKYHPLSKLLMGNMIGLTSEQSIALRTTSRVEPSDNVEKNSTVDGVAMKSFKTTSEDLIDVRCYKFRRRKRLSRKMASRSDGRGDKSRGSKLSKDSDLSYDALAQNAGLQSVHDTKEPRTYASQPGTSKRDLYSGKCDGDMREKSFEQNDAKEGSKVLRVETTQSVKKTIDGRNDLRSHLRKGIKPSVKKHIHKKKRREIANLLIDAKIGPKVRGPRNRRLRCMSSAYTKRSHESFSTVICTLNKCTRNSEMPERRSGFKERNGIAKVAGHKRIESKQGRGAKRSESLSLKRTRNHKGLEVPATRKYKGIVNKGQVVGKKMTDDSANSNDGSKRPKQLRGNVKNVRSSESMLPRNRKRKLIQTVPVELSCNGVKEYPRKANDEKKATKPCTMDAITQCSLISEEFVVRSSSRERTEHQSRHDGQRDDPRNCVKIEYNDSNDMKSEMYETIISDDDNYEECRSSRDESEKHEYCCTERNTESSKSSETTFHRLSSAEDHEGERISAFVPVNALDSGSRIARLRSIGFKPIGSQPHGAVRVLDHGDGSCSTSHASRVVKQDVAEKYNKYTNEDNNLVVYMDEELQYQDIEDEDEVSLPKRCKASTSAASVESASSKDRSRWEESEKDSSMERDLEPPWHGWKKVVTNKDSYWIGW